MLTRGLVVLYRGLVVLYETPLLAKGGRAIFDQFTGTSKQPLHL